MADYVDPPEKMTPELEEYREKLSQVKIGYPVTHYPNDGHPQCKTTSDIIPGKTYTIVSEADQEAYEKAFKDAVMLGHRDPAEVAASDFLRSIGVDLAKEHHRGTPRRLAAAMKELTVREEFKFTTFEAKSQNMITLGPIPFYTLCAHHTLPFHGHAWIGYVPDERIAGLSKFARAVGYVAKGFHVQEELTTELHDFLNGKLQPKGLAIVMKAEHMCMAMRGVRASGVITTTSEMSGVFADHARTAKAEFLEWIRNG